MSKIRPTQITPFTAGDVQTVLPTVFDYLTPQLTTAHPTTANGESVLRLGMSDGCFLSVPTSEPLTGIVVLDPDGLAVADFTAAADSLTLYMDPTSHQISGAAVSYADNLTAVLRVEAGASYRLTVVSDCKFVRLERLRPLSTASRAEAGVLVDETVALQRDGSLLLNAEAGYFYRAEAKVSNLVKINTAEVSLTASWLRFTATGTVRIECGDGATLAATVPSTVTSGEYLLHIIDGLVTLC